MGGVAALLNVISQVSLHVEARRVSSGGIRERCGGLTPGGRGAIKAGFDGPIGKTEEALVDYSRFPHRGGRSPTGQTRAELRGEAAGDCHTSRSRRSSDCWRCIA
jgi:hypothetical protein